ncbi:MAG: cation diffusion facilitator family transporter [Hyphomicrobiaceae bacterium]
MTSTHRHHHPHGDQSHGHDHGAEGHTHAHAVTQANETRVGLAAALTALFLVAEVAGGLWSGSLALLADAGHMLTDAASLALAWAAFRIARRPSDWTRTYGFHRFQVVAAYTNGLTLFFIAGVIVYEATMRLREPVAVLGGPMLAVAVLGLLVNIASFLALHGADRENLNVRGAMLHVLGDLLGSAAAIVAAVVILWTGWTPIDPLLSMLVAVLILRSAWFLVWESAHILLEAAPRGLDIPAMRADLMASIPGLEDVHHIHAWSLTEERPMVTLHARVADQAEAGRVATALRERLASRYRIGHATIEVECGDCADPAGC